MNDGLAWYNYFNSVVACGKFFVTDFINEVVMRQKKKLKKYIFDTFQFELYKEELIHRYLCKEKLSKKQMKQLDKNVRFERYKEWKTYIAERYNVCDKDSLIEFDKILNLLLQDSKTIDDYSRFIWTAYISTILTVFMTMFTDMSKIGNISLIIGMIILPFGVGFVICKIYNEYASGGKTILFLNDVKEIIQEMIENR